MRTTVTRSRSPRRPRCAWRTGPAGHRARLDQGPACLVVRVRSPVALRLATISARIASTAPSQPFSAPRGRPDWAARAALTASSGSDLPCLRCPGGRSGLLPQSDGGLSDVTGQTRAVAAGPFDADQGDDPHLPSQPSRRVYPAAVAGNCGGQCRPFLWLRARTQPLAVGPVNPGLLPRPGRSDRQCRLGARKNRGQADRSSRRQPELRQPNRRSARDPGPRPYARNIAKPRKQGWGHIHSLPVELSVNPAARSRNTAAAARPPRRWARPADRSSSAATSSSEPRVAWARCQARRSGSACASVTSASAVRALRRSPGDAAR